MRVRLTRAQSNIYQWPARFKVIVAGRRFGKTNLALIFLIGVALLAPELVCWYVAPTYKMAKEIAWGELKRMVPRWMLSRDPDESGLTIVFRNGSRISLKGANNPDSLRGVTLAAVVLDEYAQMDPEVWEIVLRPTLSFGGPAMFIGTPAGFNHFHALYMRAMSLQATGDQEWAAWQYTTAQGGIITPEELRSARNSMSAKQYRQEYEASFEALSGRVYESFDRRFNVRTDIGWIAEVPTTIVGIDFNIVPGMHGTIAQRVADQLWFLDDIMVPTANTEEFADEVLRRYPIKIKPWLPSRLLKTWPDPTGDSRKTSAPVGTTDYTILRRKGFRIFTPGHPYPLADKHNTVNAALCNAAGIRRVYVHPRCERLIMAWEGLTYKEGTGVPDTSSPHIHMADAGAYPICGELPMTEPFQQAPLRM